MGYDISAIRLDFPALSETHRGRPIVYLDNACMTLKPRQVVDALVAWYHTSPGCHGRSDHLFGQRTTRSFDDARSDLRKFIGARLDREVLFTRNATESINLVARGLGLKPGDVVLTSELEHNSNLVPWQVLAEQTGVKHQTVPVRPDTTFDLPAFVARLAGGDVRLVSILHTSNLTGVTFPVAEICEAAHRHGALVLVDAAQAPLTHALDVRALGVDFLALSVHKMLGPTGVGLLYVRDDHLERLRPLVTGGETVLDTTYTTRVMAPAPDRFEAGLQDYAGVVGAGAAARYVARLNPERIHEHVVRLNERVTEGLSKHRGVRILGPAAPGARGGIVNFVVAGLQASDLSRILNDAGGIMVRAGRHCVHSWYNSTLTPDSLRISLGPYTSDDDVDALLSHLDGVLKHFR